MMTIKGNKHSKWKNENGLTLIEVLASIVLLMIIITIFLNVFIQSSQTNSISGDIVDATYLAQTEMERIYEKSLEVSYHKREMALTDLGYQTDTTGDEWIVFKKEITLNYYANIKLQKHAMTGSENMNRVILTIHKGSAEEKQLALMENIVVWEADAE